MNNILIFFSSFVTVLLCLLLLFNKVTHKLRKLVSVSAVLFFLIFCFSLYTSAELRNIVQEFKISSDDSQSKEELTLAKTTKQEGEINTPNSLIEKDVKAAQTSNQKSEQIRIEKSDIIDAPIISQLPELPRGCEVTSLSMLLQHAGVNVEKMELAQRVKKDPTPFQIKNGQVSFGHPNVGFVGDMYNIEKPGYGVYHKPIKGLAEEYLPNRIVDLTGSNFDELESFIAQGVPVWIITNARFKELPPEEFKTWNTPAGQIKITYREHSVLITGYDKDYVYFNDPLTGEKNKKVPKQDFTNAWAQMGRQAISYLKDI